MRTKRYYLSILTLTCLLLTIEVKAEQNLTTDPSFKPDPATKQNVHPQTTPKDNRLNLLLFEVLLDNNQLTESLTAYETDNDVLLPLGELANLLTINIAVDGRNKTASGYILEEDRVFRVDTVAQTITLKTGSHPYPPTQVRWIDNEIYVASRLLESWLPIDFETNLNTLTLDIKPREKLPIQSRLERERLARGLRKRGGIYQDPGYPRLDRDYRLFSMPFIDQTLGVDVSRSNGDKFVNSAYSAYLTGDLLGMEASMFLTSTKAEPDPKIRLTLARYDPDAGLLGPAQARSLVLGNFNVPALANVLRGAGEGDGVLISNRPLSQPSSYGLQTLRGELPLGWDVTLYFNDALIAFQQSRPDGLYVFEDQPLVYGTNEFRLVFNGPLGQTRVERQVYILDQTLTKPGEFFYQLANQWALDGRQRTTMQFDLGLNRYLAATGGLIGLPNPNNNNNANNQLHYGNLGLRSSVLGMLLSGDYVNAEQGGALYELGLKTSLWRFSLDYTHTDLSKDFISDFFPEVSDPIKNRDRARITGSIPLSDRIRLPVALDIKRDISYDGLKSYDSNGRISVNLWNTSFTNSINWQSNSSGEFATGALQASRRTAGFGLSGQLAYSIKPDSKMDSYAITVDKGFGDASRFNVGMIHIVDPSLTTYSAGVSHHYGSFGISLSTRYSTNNDIALGFQVFMAMGREPRNGQWITDWRPMANAGSASARVFLDENMNNQFDPGEKPIENASFTINEGSRHPTQTGKNGLAYLGRLTPRNYADIAIDSGTLEDPQWMPTKKGVRILPRPGKVQIIDFPVVMTGEIDGTVFLVNEGKTSGIGNALIELVAPDGKVVATARSASDGYYVVPAIPPGKYTVRISPEQVKKFNLYGGAERDITMKPDGEFIYGIDFKVIRGPSL